MEVLFAGFADEASKKIEEQIEVTKRLEWNAIEMRNVEGGNFTTVPEAEFERAWELLQENGISVPGYGSALCNWARPITSDFDVDIDELKTAMPRMHKTGTKIIRCMSYPNDGLSEDEWRKEVIRRLRELAKMAEDGGVILGHENCDGWGGLGPQQSLDLLDAVDSDAFKLIFDTGNPVMHNQDAMEFYQGVKEHVIHIHIKDGRMIDGEMNYTYCGEGDGYVNEVIADLKQRGYDGCISIEPHLGAIVHEGKEAEDFESAAAKYVEFGRRIMSIVNNA